MNQFFKSNIVRSIGFGLLVAIFMALLPLSGWWIGTGAHQSAMNICGPMPSILAVEWQSFWHCMTFYQILLGFSPFGLFAGVAFGFLFWMSGKRLG